MTETWKNEQQMVVQLKKDLEFKDEQLIRTQEANQMQRNMIGNLQEDLRMKQQEMKNMTPRGKNQRNSGNSKFDFSGVERSEKQITQNNALIKELEDKLVERTDEFEEISDRYKALQEQAKLFQENYDQIEADYGDALQRLEEYEITFNEQEDLI